MDSPEEKEAKWAEIESVLDDAESLILNMESLIDEMDSLGDSIEKADGKLDELFSSGRYTESERSDFVDSLESLLDYGEDWMQLNAKGKEKKTTLNRLALEARLFISDGQYTRLRPHPA